MSGEFEFKEMSGKGTIHTFTRIDAAPTGFEDEVPYTVAVVDLEEGGRLLAWFGETIPDGRGPRSAWRSRSCRGSSRRSRRSRSTTRLEKPGTTWGKAASSK